MIQKWAAWINDLKARAGPNSPNAQRYKGVTSA